MTYVLLPFDDCPIESDANVNFEFAKAPKDTGRITVFHKKFVNDTMQTYRYSTPIQGLDMSVFKQAAEESTRTGVIDFTVDGLKRHCAVLNSAQPKAQLKQG